MEFIELQVLYSSLQVEFIELQVLCIVYKHRVYNCNLLQERGITWDDMDYFHENDKKIRKNGSLANVLMTSATSATAPEMTSGILLPVDPTQPSPMCANLVSAH